MNDKPIRIVINPAGHNHSKQMGLLASFCDADVRYEDLGNGENYFLERDGKTIILKVRWNKLDGGFLHVDTPQ
jgi:hypothetical protein